MSRLAAARARREAGDYAGAAALLRAGLAGPDADSRELTALLNELGMVGKYSGDFAEAEEAYRRALAIEESSGRATGASAAVILHNLAGLAHARGDAEGALPLALRGIGIRAALAEPPDPAGLADDRAALAAILIDLGRHDEARTELAEVTKGGSRYDVAVALHNLGSAQFREGDVAEAAVTLRRALRLKGAVLGRRHADLAVTQYNLACCLLRLGRRRPARRLLRHAEDILDGVVAADHPTLVAIRMRGQ